jgi:hypothetical protein
MVLFAHPESWMNFAISAILSADRVSSRRTIPPGKKALP